MSSSFKQPVYYVNPQPVVIPGLKVAYGIQATHVMSSEQQPASENWLSRLKKSVVNMVTEEAVERPIGMAQLSRSTFTATSQSSLSHKSIVKPAPSLQDYRFRLISEPR